MNRIIKVTDKEIIEKHQEPVKRSVFEWFVNMFGKKIVKNPRYIFTARIKHNQKGLVRPSFIIYSRDLVKWMVLKIDGSEAVIKTLDYHENVIIDEFIIFSSAFEEKTL